MFRDREHLFVRVLTGELQVFQCKSNLWYSFLRNWRLSVQSLTQFGKLVPIKLNSKYVSIYILFVFSCILLFLLKKYTYITYSYAIGVVKNDKEEINNNLMTNNIYLTMKLKKIVKYETLKLNHYPVHTYLKFYCH